MIVQLKHYKKLRYAKAGRKSTLPVPAEVAALGRRGGMVLTFRHVDGGSDKVVKNLRATDRFLWTDPKGVTFYAIEDDSPLAPLILWDAAHRLDVGSTLTLLGDSLATSFLEREYFAGSLQLMESAAARRVFRKTSILPAQQDAGLDAWTFGIPVGPEDATLLNSVVERILALEIPKKEILLCGRPAANFRYFDQVRIVGEDITAPPVQICAKKNRLAQEAAHPNLCLLHDRVYLPLDFGQAVRRHGDFFPLTTLQSLYFDDKFNLVPRRYSDLGTTIKARASASMGLMRGNDAANPNIFGPAVHPLTDNFLFFAANAQRYGASMYPTGSLYIVKRSVWNRYPQDENLFWVEYEDIEQGFRAESAGVPSQVNPHAMTQSLISRPLLCSPLGAITEDASGVPKLRRPWSEILPLPRKPAIKATYAVALSNLHKFANKYVPRQLSVPIPSSAALNSRDRFQFLVNVLSRAQVRLRDEDLRRLVADVEKWIVMDQIPVSFVESAIQKIVTRGVSLTEALVMDNPFLINQLMGRPNRHTFCESMDAYLHPSSRAPLLLVGSIFSGLLLYLSKNKVIYLRGGPIAYIKAVLRTTPWLTAKGAA